MWLLAQESPLSKSELQDVLLDPDITDVPWRIAQKVGKGGPGLGCKGSERAGRCSEVGF